LAVAALAAVFLFAQAVRADEAAPATASTTAATSATAPKPAGPKWFTSLSEAQAEARKSSKPILADFTGSDWCPWCIRLRSEVFNTKQFKDWAAKNVVLLELDFPRYKHQDAATKKANAELAAKYKIQGFPTVLFLTVDAKCWARAVINLAVRCSGRGTLRRSWTQAKVRPGDSQNDGGPPVCGGRRTTGICPQSQSVSMHVLHHAGQKPPLNS
jgi:thioredoxin-related protein